MKKVIFDKKNILVTGGAGFIGSHLCDELIKDNKVICLDNFSTGDERNIDHLLSNPDFEFIRHDLSEPLDLNKIPELKKFKVQFQGIQEIYNLACPTSPLHFKENLITTALANSLAIRNVLELARQHEAKLAHFSSSVIYGPRQENNPKISEDDIGRVDILSERSAYDEGKRFAETLVTNYQRVFNVDAKIIRLFRVYGPRMKLDEGFMVPDFISNALDNEDLVVYGNKDFTSSFCYISDVIDATLKLIQSEITGPINIGSDIEVNVTTVAQKIIDILKSKSKIVYKEELLFMTPLPLPDLKRAKEELGWMPIISLEKGLTETINDLRASKGLRGIKEAAKDS